MTAAAATEIIRLVMTLLHVRADAATIVDALEVGHLERLVVERLVGTVEPECRQRMLAAARNSVRLEALRWRQSLSQR